MKLILQSLRVLLFALVAGLFTFLAAQVAYAHGGIHVGDYEIVIGWHNEPAFVGEINGLEFFVENHVKEEPVNGLEDTLQLEVTFGASTRELEVEPQFDEEGAYIAYLIPTEVGDYTAHLWGDIEGTPVDVTITSGPETFDGVQAKDAMSFPSAQPTASELQSNSQTALLVGVAGLIFGLVGTYLGLQKKRKK